MIVPRMGNDRKLKHNAIGLLLIEVHQPCRDVIHASRTVRQPCQDMIHAVRTLRQQAVVIACDGLHSEYNYKYTQIKTKGQKLGTQELGRSRGIAKKHLVVLSMDNLHTDDPSILLEVNGRGALPNQNLKMTVFHHAVPGEEVMNVFPHNYVDSTQIQTLSDRESVRVRIGDILELKKDPQGVGAFFSVVGLSVADEKTITELVSCSVQLLNQFKIVPFIVSWFECREDWLDEIYCYSNRMWLKDNRTKKLNTLYQLFRRNPADFEFTGDAVKGVAGPVGDADNRPAEPSHFLIVVSNEDTDKLIEVPQPVGRQTFRKLRRYIERDPDLDFKWKFMLNGGITVEEEQENRWRIGYKAPNLLEDGDGSLNNPHRIFIERESRWFRIVICGVLDSCIFEMPFQPQDKVTFKDFREIIERGQEAYDFGNSLEPNAKWRFVRNDAIKHVVPVDIEATLPFKGLGILEKARGTFNDPHHIFIERI